MDQGEAIQIPGLVTLYPESDGVLRGELSPSPRRMVLRGRNADSGRCQLFTALSGAATAIRSGPAALV